MLSGWWSHARWGRSLQAQATKHEGTPCPHLNLDLLASIAQHNTILVATADHLVAPAFGMNWIRNVQAAGITYWLMGALDPEASLFFGQAGVRQCVNSPFGGVLKSSASELLAGAAPRSGPPACHLQLAASPRAGPARAQARSSAGAASTGARRCGRRCTWPTCWCSRATTSFSATWM
jgi:hypothetical protein